MRIAVWHDLPSGGGLRVLDDQVRGLLARGHEVHLWSPPPARRFEAAAEATTVHEVAFERARPRRLTKLESAWRGRRPDLDAFAEHSARCAREIDSLRPDVVLAHERGEFRPPAIGALLDAPSAFYMAESNRRLFEAGFGFPWIARPSQRRSVRELLIDAIDVEYARIEVRAETDWIHAYDEVLVNSAYSRESLQRAYGRDGRICAPGVDLARFPLLERPSHTRGTVMMAGSMTVGKNPRFLVRAMAAAGPAVQRFVWVANVTDEVLYRDVAELAAGLDVSLDLRRQLTDQELLHAFGEADVFVFAPRLEPFGLAPLEANATGLPVVTIAEGGPRETIVDGANGVVVEADPDAFGAAVADLLGDIERTRDLGRAAHEHVARHWGVDASITRLEDALRVVAARQVDRTPVSR